LRALPGYLDELVPAGGDDDLRALLAKDAARRLRRALSRWPLRAPSIRDRRTLASGSVRTWLASVEDALETRDLARRARDRRPGSAAWTALLDRVADLGALASLAPSGALPRDFPRRAEARASRELKRLSRTLRGALRVGEADVRDPGAKVRHLVREQGGGVPARAARTFSARVPRALDLLDAAWREAHRMVLGRTHAIVPIDDPGVVSYSSAREPGIAYVNVRSSPLVRLAEDLLHEATHMRVHEIESLHPLVTGGDARFYSPWRREWRPLRGILHGACTFTVGAAFFERMLRASEGRSRGIRFSSARTAWLSRRFLEEMESTRVALATLGSAAARRLLTPEGRAVVRAVARARARLLPSCRKRRRQLARLDPAELRAFEAFRRGLAARPFRSEAHRLASL
jgi:hypothetical protein